MSRLALRPAAAANLEAIRAIYAHEVRAGTSTFETEPPDPAEITARHHRIVAAGLPYLVAADAGTVVGFGYASPFRPRPAYRWTVEDSIYVRPEDRGRGVGSALLGAVIDAATSAGCHQMVAVIGDPDDGASIALHRRAGFHLAGRLEAVGFKFGRWLDVVLMQRALRPAAERRPRKP